MTTFIKALQWKDKRTLTESDRIDKQNIINNSRFFPNKIFLIDDIVCEKNGYII